MLQHKGPDTVLYDQKIIFTSDQDNCDAEPQAKQDDNSKQMIENEEDDTNGELMIFSSAGFRENPRYCYSLGMVVIVVVIVMQKL